MFDIHDLATDYAFGNLSGSDLDSFEAHLDDCEPCLAEVSKIMDAGARLLLAENEEVPDALHGRVSASIESQAAPERRGRRAFGVWGIAAALLIFVGGILVFASGDPIGNVLGAEDVMTAEMMATADYAGSARVFLTTAPSEEGAVVTVEGLSPLDDDQVYELWIIGESGPVPAGLIQIRGPESEQVLLDGFPLPGSTVAITVEPAGGSTAPTGPPLFVFEV